MMMARLTKEQEAMVEQNLNLVYGAIRHYGLRVRFGHLIEWEDMEQIGKMALCKAVLRHDLRKGELSTMAYIVIRNEIYKEADKHRKYSGITVVSLDDENMPELWRKDVDEAIMCAAINEAIDKVKMRGSLTIKRGVIAMQLKARGYKTLEIREMLGGLSTTMVNRDIKKARARLRDELA